MRAVAPHADSCKGRRTVDGLVFGNGEDLRLPRVGLVAQVGPRGVARAGGDAAGHQRLQQGAGSSSRNFDNRLQRERQAQRRRRQLLQCSKMCAWVAVVAGAALRAASRSAVKCVPLATGSAHANRVLRHSLYLAVMSAAVIWRAALLAGGSPLGYTWFVW